MDMKVIGEQIRQYRKMKGLTQEQLAKESGLSTMSIRRYESGERIAQEDRLIKIAKALDIRLQDLTDTFVWAGFDKQFPGIEENPVRFNAITAYLKEMGFSVDFTPEGTAKLEKDGHKAQFNHSEFEELQAGAKEVIEGRFYKKVLEQQKQE